MRRDPLTLPGLLADMLNQSLRTYLLATPAVPRLLLMMLHAGHCSLHDRADRAIPAVTKDPVWDRSAEPACADQARRWTIGMTPTIKEYPCQMACPWTSAARPPSSPAATS